MAHLWEERLLTQVINISGNGDNTVITPGSGEMPAAWDNAATYIAIDFISLIPNASVTITFNSGTGGEGQTSRSGPMNLQTAQTITWENSMQNEHGVIELAANRSFVINLSAPVQVSGLIRYRLLMSN